MARFTPENQFSSLIRLKATTGALVEEGEQGFVCKDEGDSGSLAGE